MPETAQPLSGIQQDPMNLPDPGETHRSVRDQVEAVNAGAVGQEVFIATESPEGHGKQP
jgi:hypothetical protein